jgi:hypothetical protein
MPPVVHLTLLILSMLLFGIDAYISPGPTRLTCAGLAVLVASMINW